MVMRRRLSRRCRTRRLQKQSRARTVVLVGGLVAIVAGTAAAGVGWTAFSRLNGAGPQPESVLPADTVAFMKVDLNPSAGQKVAAVRFALRFPEAKGQVTETSDLRKVAFDQMKQDAKLKDVDYAADVEPWLGERFAVGLLPGATSKDKPIPVAVLAVTDEDKAAEALPRITGSGKTACGVRDGFAICSEDHTVVTLLTRRSRAPRSPSPSSSQPTWGHWARTVWRRPGSTSSGWARSLTLPDSARVCSAPPARYPDPRRAPGRSSRGRAPLRGPTPRARRPRHRHVDRLAGQAWQRHGRHRLPADTLGAFGLSGASEQVKTGWASAGGALKDLQEAEQELGVSLPDDLYAALGDRAAIAYGGLEDDQLRVALRTPWRPGGRREVRQGLGQQRQGLLLGSTRPRRAMTRSSPPPRTTPARSPGEGASARRTRSVRPSPARRTPGRCSTSTSPGW